MKVLLVLVACYVLVWLLRRSFRSRSRPPPGSPKAPQTMLACAQCGVHLPSDEALPGRGGVFCSEPHRAAFERERTER